MKFRNITAMLGLAAAAGFSGQAMALLPTTTPEVVINISGASAQQKTLGALLSSFCVAGTLTTYKDDPTSGSDGKKWRSYYCTLDGANPSVPASLAGLDVLFNNRSAGGSIWGVVPVAREWAVEYLNIFSGNCSGTSTDQTCTWDTDRATGLIAFAAGTSGLECPFSPYSAGSDLYVSTSSGDIFAHAGTTAESTVCLRSDGGVSDVEPAMFSATANFPGFTGGPLSPAEIGTLTVKSEYGVIFGFSVTDNVYKHLQVLQGLATYADIDTDPVITGDAARPSLPLTAIASLLSGQLKSFQELDQGIGAPAGGPSDFMAVCRRVVGSGTQAAQNAFAMRNPCLGGSGLDMLSDPDGGGAGAFVNGKQFVVNNSGSGDVIDCQNDAIDGTLLGGPIDAIGFNAIEKTPGASDKWQYIKVDGVDPTVTNAIAGKYTHVFEQTIQWPSASTAGAALDALNMVASASGDPAVMISAGLSGVAALPSNGFDWETDFPTLRTGRGGDSCKPMRLEVDAP